MTQLFDLDRCVHCGLCLNACPTYRELGLEADSPRGRVYQMVQVATGKAQINPSYVEHLDLCLACRGCESACPSGVRYGHLIEVARAEIEAVRQRSWLSSVFRNVVFHYLLPSRKLLSFAAWMLWIYQRSGLQKAVRSSGLLRGSLGRAESLSPRIETPFFFRAYGRVYPAEGEQRYRVAMLGGCIANVSFARLNEATVRVLRKNGCEVTIPAGQTCCGALHVHSGLRDEARALAQRNIDAIVDGGYDAIITNAAGCGSTLKEYGELLEHAQARKFSGSVKDISEFLASISLNTNLGRIEQTVTYQDSCHLAHGQKIRSAPRSILRAIPGVVFREMPLSDLCCGSAGIYNVVQGDMAAAILEKKMPLANSTRAEVIATANPGCMLQLRAGVARHGAGQRVAHVVELLDEAYAAYHERE
jgi:glycolate oxidase iron-sulfur subunit